MPTPASRSGDFRQAAADGVRPAGDGIAVISPSWRAMLLARQSRHRHPGGDMNAGWIYAPAVAIILGAGPAHADEKLAKRAGCLECHAVDKKVIGPAFHDVA